MTQGHGHGQVHKPRAEKPRHAKAREKAIYDKAQKPPSHGGTPQALEKAVRGQRPHGSSRHRVERQLQHEKEKHEKSTAPNKLEKAVRDHGLHRSEKQHTREHEQHRGEETPNKLEKAVRRHASPRSEQQQKQEQQKHEQHQKERTPNKLEKAVREHLLLQDKKQQTGETQFPHEKPQHSWHDRENLTDLSKLPEPVRKSIREEVRMIQHSTTMRDEGKQGILYTLGEISLGEYQKALGAPYLPVLRSFFGGDTQNSSKEESMTRASEQQKPERQKQEQRSRETPNKLEKAVREHASQRSEQPQHAERQDSTSQANRNAHRTSLQELGSHSPEKTPHILLESYRGDFSPGSQQQQAHDKSLPSEEQRDKQAPGTLEKRSGEKPQSSRDKSDAQERRSSVHPPNAVDQAVRAHRDETKTDDPTRSHHDQTISAKEREERLRIATPADGVGFQFDSAQLNPGSMERWYGNLQESERAALSDPHAHVLIMTSASRPGSDSYNKQLSFERGNAVLQWLQDHDARAHIDIYPVGEDLAKKAGKPDRVDDASDRVARIEIIPSFTPKEGVEKILGQAPQPTKENKTLKAGGELFAIAKDTGKDALKSPETAPEKILKGIGKVVKWMAEHTLQDISEARIEREISSNFIPAFRGEIERLTESRQQHFPSEDNVFAQRGRETARQIWDNLPIGTQDGLKNLAHSDQGDAFRKQLGEAMQNQYISKDIKYLHQDLHFNIP